MSKQPKKPEKNGNSHLGFEAQLWAAADKMRGRMNVRFILANGKRTEQPSNEVRNELVETDLANNNTNT